MIKQRNCARKQTKTTEEISEVFYREGFISLLNLDRSPCLSKEFSKQLCLSVSSEAAMGRPCACCLMDRTPFGGLPLSGSSEPV